MGQTEPMEEIVVEKMAERSVTNVMHQGRHAKKFFNEIRRRNVRKGFFQEWIEVARESAGHVHGSKGVDEPGMFRGGIDPPGAL
jgi:hypothetical protein